MVTDIEEMDRIIGQFVDFGRDGQSESDVDLDIGALLEEIHADYLRRGLALSLEGVSHFTIKARPLALRRAITNLIDNAHRYAGHGQDVDLALRRDGGHLRDRGSRSRPGHSG